MWTPKSFERRPATLQPALGSPFYGTELVIDDTVVSNAVEMIGWGDDPIHLKVCEQCLEESCHDGDWVSVRRAGACVLFLPVFSRRLEEWQADLYGQTPSFLLKGAVLLDRTRYHHLRTLVPDLPKIGDLTPLAGWEAVRLLCFEAPSKVLGDRSAPVQLQPNLLLATDSHRETGEVAATLEELLETWAESWAPVVLKPLRGPRWEVTLFLDQKRGALDWQPLAVGYAWARLLLAPGYFVDEQPRLAAEGQIDTLIVSTRLHAGAKLWPEIFVDNELLVDFAGSRLGVDLLELAKSLGGDGEYFVLTCSCGELGCAGFSQGIDVIHDGEYVHWVLHLATPTDPLRFQAEAYRKAIMHGLEEFRELCSENPNTGAIPAANLDFWKVGDYPGSLLANL